MSGSHQSVTAGVTGNTKGKRRKAPKRTFRHVTFKVFEDSDADIIEWLDALDAGDQSEALRTLIKNAIKGKQSYQPEPEASPFDEVLAQLADIQRMLQSGVVAVMPQEAAVIITPDEPTLSAEEMARRKTKMQRGKW